MQKNGKFQEGVTVNLTGNPGGQLQKNRYPQHGRGVKIFFLEKPNVSAIILTNYQLCLLFSHQVQIFITSLTAHSRSEIPYKQNLRGSAEVYDILIIF